MEETVQDDRPFAMALDAELLERIRQPVVDGLARSVSALIRDALDQIEWDQVVVEKPVQEIISVRLPSDLRETLKRVADREECSVGFLVRFAVDRYLPNLTQPVAKPKKAKPTRPVEKEPAFAGGIAATRQAKRKKSQPAKRPNVSLPPPMPTVPPAKAKPSRPAKPTKSAKPAPKKSAPAPKPAAKKKPGRGRFAAKPPAPARPRAKR